MAQPVWITPSGSLGTIPEGQFFQTPILAEDPVITSNVTSVSTTGTEVTLNFVPLPTIPYEVGGTIVVSGFTPSTYNGSYTVTGATTGSVKYTNSSTALNLRVISVTSTGTSVTLNFTTRPTAPFSIGDSIVVAGFNPDTYNGTFIVTGVTTSSVTFASSANSYISRYGTITDVVPGTVENIPKSVFFKIISGNLPAGMQCASNGLLAGIPKAVVDIQGVPTPVSQDITSKFSARVYTTKTVNGVQVTDRISDQTFTITVTGQDIPEFITPAGRVGTYFDAAQITDLQIEYTDFDPADTVIVRLKSGQLPPGLTISSTGLISGLIDLLPKYDPDTGDILISKTYNFTLEVTDGKAANIRSFNILVYARQAMTADNTYIHSDNTFITTDVTPTISPVLISPSVGSLGVVRNDNFYAIQFVGINLAGGEVNYELVYPTGATPLPGLTLDPGTGWLYGNIPPLGITENTYNFSVRAYMKDDPTSYSGLYNYNLTIVGPVSTDITWITPSNLGTINNGDVSLFYVEAINAAGIGLQYQLKSGVYNSLPQGLQLLPSGHIAGHVSFDTFTVDGGTTTFDATNNSIGASSVIAETTFDLVHTFTVNAYSVNGLISVYKTFSITVNRAYNKPYNNLYVQCMPPQNDRDLIASLLQNTDIFQPDILYRPDDPNFGKATQVVYWHAYGLNPATYSDYVLSLYENHYWKDLILGNISVAQALDADGVPVYEVVYSRVIDNLVNDAGESVSKQVTLPYPITLDDSSVVDTVFPNSLIDMRDQVIDQVGQLSNVLPLWMTSKQSNGRVLGFTPSWVIAYTKPGYGDRLAYYINTIFGERLNLIDFEVDRYELDRLLTKNWNTETQQWNPHPATYTRFDAGVTDDVSLWGNWNYSVDPPTFTSVNWVNDVNDIVTWTNSYDGDQTTFDQNSMMFIDPVDMYSNTQVYDKYLVFPKKNILG